MNSVTESVSRFMLKGQRRDVGHRSSCPTQLHESARPAVLLFCIPSEQSFCRVVKSIRAVVGIAEACVLAPEGSCSILDLCERRCVSLIFVFGAPFVYRNAPVHVDAHVCARYQTSSLVDMWALS